MLVIDIDDFKPINDEEGHQQGDAVLRRVAEIVKDTTRAIDITARYGGDELALVLLETDAAGALTLAERLRSRISAARIPARGGGETHVTVSIGAATLPDCALDAGELIEAADQALLRAKRTGKDQVASAPALNGSAA
jgi:diguanylate cyclase (GGDEF)-like protein